MPKLTSQLRKGEIAGVYLLACNSTDAWLPGLNSLRFSRLRIDRGWAFPYSPSLMRPCDGTSGLVRKNRRKAVFAFKGLFPKGICHVFALGQWVFIAVFGSTGNRKPPSATRFLPTEPQGTSARLLSGRQISVFHRTSGSVCFRHAASFGTPERNGFSHTRTAGRCTVSFRCDWPPFPADIVLVLLSCYSSFTAGVKLW